MFQCMQSKNTVVLSGQGDLPPTPAAGFPPGLLVAFRGPGKRSVASNILLEVNMTGSRDLRQFCTFGRLMLRTAGHKK